MSEISELFARDPLSITRDDLTKITQHYRENRERWNATGKAPRKAKAEPAEKLVLADLGDLDE